MKVGDKSNEIPAARKLLRSMQLSGRIVTADAMHTQVETAQLILDREADYGCQGQGDARRKRLTGTAVGKSETKNARSNRHSQLSGRRTRQNLGRVRRTARTTVSIPYAYVIRKAVGTTSEIAYGATSVPPRRICRVPRSPSLGKPACPRHDLRRGPPPQPRQQQCPCPRPQRRDHPVARTCRRLTGTTTRARPFEN